MLRLGWHYVRLMQRDDSEVYYSVLLSYKYLNR